MKLTEDKLKQMIAEELENIHEQEPQPEQPQDSAKEKVDSVSKLKMELTQVAKNIQTVKGLDAAEVNLISSLIGVILSLSSAGSASTILKRVYDVLQKQAK
jgi:acyl carrier protein